MTHIAPMDRTAALADSRLLPMSAYEANSPA